MTVARTLDRVAHSAAEPQHEPEAERTPATLSGPGPRTVFSPPSFTMPFAIGDVLADKYQVVSLMGVGGISFVVAALHRGFDSYVALKFLRPEFAQHPEAARRFTIEAKSNFKLRSEHIVRVLDVDRLPDGKPFMVMERLSGVDLRVLIGDRGPLPIELAVDFALQICEALATAHAAHVVHRDIKPENLFVTKQREQPERIKVLDFGICREVLTTDQPHQRIVTTEAVGSPPYMSPEQVRGAPDVDARSDIWSLGCVLHEMLSGHALFQRQSAPEAFAAVLEAPALLLRELRPEIPEELELVVQRCLSKLAKDRYQSVAELAAALTPFAPPRAYVNAERCAEILNEVADRSSGVQSTARSSSPGGAKACDPADALGVGQELTLRTVASSQLRERSKPLLKTLALFIAVPTIAALAWLSVRSIPPSSAQRQAPGRVVPQRNSETSAQREAGPVTVSPLAPAAPPAREAEAAAPRARIAATARTSAWKKPSVKTTAQDAHSVERLLPPELRPLVPKPDPYSSAPELGAADPDVGF